jgi:hypothetical protein
MSDIGITIIAALIGILTGALGFLLPTFYFQPILRYRDAKFQILSDLIFYANAINTDVKDLQGDVKEEFEKRGWARVEANRRNSADLMACFHNLPSIYRWFLRRRGENPDVAASELMGFSNTHDWDIAAARCEKIRNSLRFPRYF